MKREQLAGELAAYIADKFDKNQELGRTEALEAVADVDEFVNELFDEEEDDENENEAEPERTSAR